MTTVFRLKVLFTGLGTSTAGGTWAERVKNRIWFLLCMELKESEDGLVSRFLRCSTSQQHQRQWISWPKPVSSQINEAFFFSLFISHLFLSLLPAADNRLLSPPSVFTGLTLIHRFVFTSLSINKHQTTFNLGQKKKKKFVFFPPTSQTTVAHHSHPGRSRPGRNEISLVHKRWRRRPPRRNPADRWPVQYTERFFLFYFTVFSGL